MKNLFTFLLYLFFFFSPYLAFGQKVNVGSGSYATVFPGVDAANRNDYPRKTPQLSGVAVGKPIPTNEWWSDFLVNDHGGNAFNYPLSFRSVSSGLVVNYTWPNVNGSHSDFREPMSDVKGVTIGLDNLNASKSTVCDYTDWTVSLNWTSNDNSFQATMGMAMPFVYFTKNGSADAFVQVGFNAQNVIVENNKLLIDNNMNGSKYIVFAPSGSVWNGSSGNFTSSLAGKNYWSMALVPDGMDINDAKVLLEPYAFVFPEDTKVTWNYDESSSQMISTYAITTDVKEGGQTNFFQGMLPHQWANKQSNVSVLQNISYKSVRGELKVVEGNTFNVVNKFYGILPTLPDLGINSAGYDPAYLFDQIELIKNDALNSWTDSYNDGQVINRLVQVAHIANQLGAIDARNSLMETVRERVEDWLSYENGEVAFLFYYNSQWTSLLGYPAGHGQDSNLNDHHFHWGYFVHAAAALEQYYPGWANQWGDMVNLLIRDAASYDRNDTMFPFLRSFSPYAGHCWANGFASFPQGNDQESTSESMQFNSALIHWGSVTGNNDIRDLGIFLYTTEQSAIEEYWFDVYQRNFQPNYKYEMAARVWGAGYDNGTFWTTDVAASYGIELYPIHGGSLYLGHNPQYVQRVWEGMKKNTGVLSKVKNDNLWYDVYWNFLSFVDPQKALELYNDYPNRSLKFGISDAHTYHWLHNMNVLGQVSTQVTADYPIAAAFDNNGIRTYVAYNYSSWPVTINYSDGFVLEASPRSMTTNKDADFTITLSVDKLQVDVDEVVTFMSSVSDSDIDRVDFYANSQLLGSAFNAPYNLSVSTLSSGIAQIYAVAVKDEKRVNSSIISVIVGKPQPYSGSPIELPGIINSAHFDVFVGSKGQGVTYFDTTPYNIAVDEPIVAFRPDEYVDASFENAEGATVGWIEAGEWLTYTVDVKETGNYRLEIRYASGVAKGGPFSISANDVVVADNIEVNGTGGWGNWATHTIEPVYLTEGRQKIRVNIADGGFNLGKMTFAISGQPNPVDPGNENDNPNNGEVEPGICTDVDESGDFSWIITEEDGKTYLTFIPELDGAGSSLLLLYYSTSPSAPFPGYLVRPNEPIELTVNGGATVYFYFTYNHPLGGERNNLDRKASFVPGSCKNISVMNENISSNSEIDFISWPNPFSNIINLSFSQNSDFEHVIIYDITGNIYLQQSVYENDMSISTNNLPNGMYFIKACGSNGCVVKKIVRANKFTF